jgi:hypothetical protein
LAGVRTQQRYQISEEKNEALRQWENQSALARDEQQEKKFSNEDKSHEKHRTDLDRHQDGRIEVRSKQKRGRAQIERRKTLLRPARDLSSKQWIEEQMPTQKSLAA